MNDNNDNKTKVKLHSNLPHHSRQLTTKCTPPIGCKPTKDDDDETVVTSNVSTCGSTTSTCSTSSWTTVGTTPTPPSKPQPTNKPALATVNGNYYHVLSLKDDDIVVDSGASAHFGDEDTPGLGRTLTTDSITMASATGDQRCSIATDTFDLPLDRECLDYHVFRRGEIQRPLFSVGKACDAGYRVTFDDQKCTFTRDGTVQLTGYRDHSSGLYLLPRQNHKEQRPQAALNAYTEHTIPKLIRYLHACAGFPVPETWIKAISQGYYLSWPGLTPSRVRQYLPKSTETAMGHLKLVRQGTRSTQQQEPTAGPEARPTSQHLGRRRNIGTCSIPLKDLKNMIGTDQTGRFPITSDRGHKYIFVLYDVDTEYIRGIPIKSRKTGELIRAFQEGYAELTKCGFEPVLHRIDNETSAALIDAIEAKGLTYEVVPPGNHRRNPAERAIQTFKSHFIAILNGVDENYPEGAWDHLITQTNLTLNILRPCRINPAHSAHSYIYGPYNFDAHPLAPLGCKAIIHERAIGKGGKRSTWGNRGKLGYYIGPELNSYRAWRFYMPDTGGIQVTDTAEFFPKHTIPSTTTTTQINDSLDTIVKMLKDPIPPQTRVITDKRIGDIIDGLRNALGVKPNGRVGPSTNSTARDAVVREQTQPMTATVRTNDKHHKNRQSAVTPPRVQGQDATAPRVSSNNGKYTGINRYRPKKKQRYPVGTRVRVVEKKNGKKEVFIGKAEEYDAKTGLYRVVFDDGEFDEFDDEEMEYFQLIRPFKMRAPTTAANQITVHGFFPKAGPTPRIEASTLYGLNAGSIWDEETKQWMAYRDLIKHKNHKIRERWNQAGLNEFARLAQGYGEVKGMDVITFIAKMDMPTGKQATYARYVVDYRPEKDEPWRLRITCGGDKLDYYGDTTTHSATMETIKCQLNNIISTKGAKCATADISNMYLGSDLPEAEYVRFRLNLIPGAFIQAYKLNELATPNGFVYARVNKAWYGLKQAGKIAHDDLVQRLAEAGYKKAALVEGYFKHETRDIDFTLVVDDFLIRYQNKEDLEHLQQAIGKYYKLKVDLEAKQYVGINLKWDYDKRTVRLSMDGYVKQALLELEHSAPKKPHHAPSKYTPPSYGAKVQLARTDETAPLGKKQITYIQRAVGKLLYYARAVDPTMLHAINDISLSAAKGTEATLDAITYLLNYAHTHPDTEVIYRASDMVLRVDSDAAYLVAPEARSRAGGYHYMSNTKGTIFNGPVLVLAKVIKNVMASATEAELGALFMNAQEAVALRNCLEAMGHKQPATPLKTDNNTANGIINNTMKQKRSKAIDVRFYWLRDRVNQGQFYVHWDAGVNNLADYFTKHHPASYHRRMRPIQTYVKDLSPESLQGCIRMMNEGQTVRDQP